MIFLKKSEIYYFQGCRGSENMSRILVGVQAHLWVQQKLASHLLRETKMLSSQLSPYKTGETIMLKTAKIIKENLDNGGRTSALQH